MPSNTAQGRRSPPAPPAPPLPPPSPSSLTVIEDSASRQAGRWTFKTTTSSSTCYARLVFRFLHLFFFLVFPPSLPPLLSSLFVFLPSLQVLVNLLLFFSATYLPTSFYLVLVFAVQESLLSSPSSFSSTLERGGTVLVPPPGKGFCYLKLAGRRVI